MNPNKPVEMCACGFPQSHPIPHEHDRTEREKAIIEALERENKKLAEQLAAVPNDCREVCEDHKALKAKLRRAEAQLAAIEKDLRDILKSLYCPDEGYLEIETSEIYNDIHGLLGKHFPDKKAVGKRKEDE